MNKGAYAYLIRHASMIVMAWGVASLLNTSTNAYAFNATTTLSDIPVRSLDLAVSNGQSHNDLYKASAAEMGAGAENFISSMATRALEFLGSAAAQEQKKASFRALLNDSFDLETIGRFALGRYWKTAATQERNEYLILFRKMIVEVYAKRFGDYKGQKFETRGHRVDGDKDTIVTSYIIPGDGPEVQVDWRVRYKNSKYQIVDVIVEGVSMSVTQRSDFAAVIQRGGGDIQVLLNHLRGGSQ